MKLQAIDVTYEPFGINVLVKIETVSKIKAAGRKIPVIPGDNLKSLTNHINTAMKEIVSELNANSSGD